MPGFVDYEVSDHGNVRRVTAAQGTFPGRLLRPNTKTNSYGYKYLRLCVSKKQTRCLYVHHLVALAFIGPKPGPDYQIAHKNGMGGDNYVGNIRWATRQENEADKVAHGKTNRGERHGMSFLTEVKVRHIRNKGTTTEARRKLAAKYRTTERNIRHIVSGKGWKHLTP